MAKAFLYLLAIALLHLLFLIGENESTIPEPKAPHFQYFERPKYRYPVYDKNGKGYLRYGYGGPETYRYETYSQLEGIH